MSEEGLEFGGLLGVVEPAGAVLTARDESGAVFVEADVGEGERVALDHFVFLLVVFLGVFLFVDEFEDEFVECVPPVLADDLLFLQDGLHQVVDVCFSG